MEVVVTEVTATCVAALSLATLASSDFRSISESSNGPEALPRHSCCSSVGVTLQVTLCS